MYVQRRLQGLGKGPPLGISQCLGSHSLGVQQSVSKVTLCTILSKLYTVEFHQVPTMEQTHPQMLMMWFKIWLPYAISL